MTSRTTDRTRIGADELIEIDGRLAKILSLNRSEAGDGLIALIQFGDGEFQRMKWADLARRLLNRQPSGTTPAADGPHSPLLEELPDTDRAHYLHVYRQLLQVSTGSPNGNPDADREAGVLEPAFDPNLTTKHQRVAAMVQLRRTRGEGGASPATIYRQLERVKQKGIDGLIHGNRKLPRDLLAAHDPAVVDRIRQFLALHKSEAQISTKRLIVLVAADLESRSLGTDMEKQTIGKLVGEISRGMALDRPASSRRTHSRKPDRVHGRHEVNAPGEMVQIDGTSTTIHVWDDKLHWVPAVVLDAIDCYSREVLALRVCARASTARDVAMLLSDIGRPTVSRAGWPYDLDHWHGVPRLACVVDQNRAEGPGDRIIGTKVALQPSTIVLDNGADMSADQLVAAAERMGITVVFCPPATPHAKGMIEGVQNAIREIQSLLPGYKGENPVNHPAAIESGAMLTAQDLHDALRRTAGTGRRCRHCGAAHAKPSRGRARSAGRPAGYSGQRA